MSKHPHTMTKDSVTVVIKGETHTIKKGEPNFNKVRHAVAEEEWDSIPALINKGLAIEEWAKGDFKFKENHIHYKGDRMPMGLNDRMLKMAANGDSPVPLMRFWERLQLNPSMRSVDQLWGFLAHGNVPIDQDGFILAYKGVTSDLKDAYTKKISNKVGVINKMPRNKISDDPRQACHAGFHVGALSYAKSFSSKTIICKVDPADVVCVPYDHNQQKMRVCEYEVIGHYGAPLPDTTIKTKPARKRKSTKAPRKAVKKATGRKARGSAKAAAPRRRRAKLDTPAGVPNYNRLRESGLYKQKVHDLRKYATHVVKIVGASRLGKDDLIKTILKIRSK